MIISIPRHALILLVGLSGAGKSTFARKHFREHEVVSSDRCREFVCDNAADQEATADAFELVHLIADKRLRRDRVVVIDATNLKAVDRAPLIGLAARYGARRIAILLNPGAELCWQRNDKRQRKVSRDVIETQAARLTTLLVEIADEVDELYELCKPEEIDAAVVRRVDAKQRTR